MYVHMYVVCILTSIARCYPESISRLVIPRPTNSTAEPHSIPHAIHQTKVGDSERHRVPTNIINDYTFTRASRHCNSQAPQLPNYPVRLHLDCSTSYPPYGYTATRAGAATCDKQGQHRRLGTVTPPLCLQPHLQR